MPASDYSLVTYDDGKNPRPWHWEIKRLGKSLGVKLSGGGYQSQAAAEFAGKRELQEFLTALALEEKNKHRQDRLSLVSSFIPSRSPSL